jgi:hypothetical protein
VAGNRFVGTAGSVIGGVIGGVALGIAVLLLLVVSVVGVRAWLRDSPSERARKEASAFFVDARGLRVATVDLCRQTSNDGQYRTFRCKIRNAQCARSFRFIEEATDFAGHDLQPVDLPDRALANPCLARSDQ